MLLCKCIEFFVDEIFSSLHSMNQYTGTNPTLQSITPSLFSSCRGYAEVLHKMRCIQQEPGPRKQCTMVRNDGKQCLYAHYFVYYDFSFFSIFLRGFDAGKYAITQVEGQKLGWRRSTGLRGKAVMCIINENE